MSKVRGLMGIPAIEAELYDRIADKNGIINDLNARLERMTDIIRYMRHELFDAKLIDAEEFAALVEDRDNGQRVARLVGYDTIRKKLFKTEAELGALRRKAV